MSRFGVLLLAPQGGSNQWDVLGVERDSVIGSVRFVDALSGDEDEASYEFSSIDDAVYFSREALSLFTEGNLPRRQDHFLPYLRSFAQEAWQHGMSRAEIAGILLDMILPVDVAAPDRDERSVVMKGRTA